MTPVIRRVPHGCSHSSHLESKEKIYHTDSSANMYWAFLSEWQLQIPWDPKVHMTCWLLVVLANGPFPVLVTWHRADGYQDISNAILLYIGGLGLFY